MDNDGIVASLPKSWGSRILSSTVDKDAPGTRSLATLVSGTYPRFIGCGLWGRDDRQMNTLTEMLNPFNKYRLITPLYLRGPRTYRMGITGAFGPLPGLPLSVMYSLNEMPLLFG